MLRTQSIVAVEEHVLRPREVELLVLAGIEVLRRALFERAENSAVVPVGAGIEEPVASFAEEAVPYTTHLGAIDAGAAKGRDADRVASRAAEVHPVLAARVGSLVAG